MFWCATIFEFVGTYEDLKELRCVCRHFKHLIRPSHILSMKKYNHQLILRYADQLTLLDCSRQDIAQLPERMKNMKHLNCNSNDLTTLPELPNVTQLNCNSNVLTTLPELPNVCLLYTSPSPRDS